jgi:hypothetical protein
LKVIVHIEPSVWHLDVDLSYPGCAGAAKGPIVHRLKRYMSWVNNVARQLGSYLLAQKLRNVKAQGLVREDLSDGTTGAS